MITVFMYLKGCHVQEDAKVVLLILEGRIRNNKFTLCRGIFQLSILKSFLMVRDVEEWNKLLKEEDLWTHLWSHLWTHHKRVKES